MRERMRRRSVSSLVSPGPRVPMPPPSRDSAAPAPTSRGSRYFNCASSTCSLPSRVRARRAKMSRMSCVRSTILRPTSSSIWRSCAGVSSLSKMTTSTLHFCRTKRRGVLNLAGAEKCRRIGLGPFLENAQHDLRTGRLGQAREFVHRSLGVQPARSTAATRSARPAPRVPDALRRAVQTSLNLVPRNRSGPNALEVRPRSTLHDRGGQRRRASAQYRAKNRCVTKRSLDVVRISRRRFATDVRARGGDRPARGGAYRSGYRVGWHPDADLAGSTADIGRQSQPARESTASAARARNAAASRSATRDNGPMCVAICATLAAINGSARSPERPLTANTRATAAGFIGSAASP